MLAGKDLGWQRRFLILLFSGAPQGGLCVEVASNNQGLANPLFIVDGVLESVQEPKKSF